ncbi:MAG: class I tRNA ligase family protein [Candidatus Hermodarchaeota archaeon]
MLRNFLKIKFFRQIEAKWQQKWDAAKIFVPKIDHTKTKFFMTIPYPYVFGPYHAGHGRSYATGDVFTRIRRKQGYNVLLL